MYLNDDFIIKTVRNRLLEFTPTSVPSVSELRFVTVVYARVVGIDYSRGEEELKKTQRIVKIIQETVYAHDGNFMRFSVDDRGFVCMGVYGLAPSHDNDPERAVKCGMDVTRQIQSKSEELGGVTASVGEVYTLMMIRQEKMKLLPLKMEILRLKNDDLCDSAAEPTGGWQELVHYRECGR